MALKDFLFTSESVSEGHPDKVCDQTSDAVLDAYLGVDKKARVACETLVTTDRIVVAGEVTADGYEGVDVEAVARKVSREIGYTHDDIGFNADTADVKVFLHPQSPDISQGVTAGEGLDKGQGAGDQGLMFGYACNETDELMPMPIMTAQKLVQNLAKLRKSGELSFLRPDSKSQVSVIYENGKPVKVDSLVISTQHSPDVSHDDLKEAVIEKCVKKTIDASLLKDTVYHINPTGQFIVGGPHGDCGLTGRKIIVDTYGGYARHGGGAFSGKDPSKVDRSAAYMGRYIAKNVVAAGLADQCEVQLAYAIGVSQPVSILVDCFGTEKIDPHEIEKRIKANFQTDPAGIVQSLGLLNGNIKYQETAAYGHFGRAEFPWEKTDKASSLK